MTKSSIGKTFAAPPGLRPGDESSLPRQDAVQALSCDTEQLWQTLADRFGDTPPARRPVATRLQPVIQALMTFVRGQTDRTDRVGDAFLQGCGSERHA